MLKFQELMKEMKAKYQKSLNDNKELQSIIE